jgi:hypothetical protein
MAEILRRTIPATTVGAFLVNVPEEPRPAPMLVDVLTEGQLALARCIGYPDFLGRGAGEVVPAGTPGEGRGMAKYPLVFTIKNEVFGNGFLAGVLVHDGRALMVREDDEWWIYGVQPAGIAEGGATPKEAYFSFRDTFTKMLYDSASLAPDFEAFRTDVEGLCGQTNARGDEEWQQARAEIRAGVVTPEAPLDELPRQTSETKCGVAVIRLDGEASVKFTPTENRADALATAA